MNTNKAIILNKIGKKYKISHGGMNLTLRDVISDIPKYLKRKRETHEEFWALKNISLSINKGEVVGIIGKNGSGKSTLLKILSRITQPSTGEAIIHGRVASLLEVGTGFSPELTGRENIYLNGSILGMTKNEINRKFDEIVEFAGVEKFLDVPVKRYSSGMYVRLAFAVAAHLESEILFIDEVLSVGDAEFQKKSLGKMNDVAKSGRTVLFVSHNMTAVRSLCNQAILLQNGKLIKTGDVDEVVDTYLEDVTQSNLKRVWEKSKDAPGNEEIYIQSAEVCVDKDTSGFMYVNTPIQLSFNIFNKIPNNKLNLSLLLYTLDGICVFNSPSQAQTFNKGKINFSCQIPGNLLNDGLYRVGIIVVKNKSKSIFKMDDILSFEVHDKPRESGWLGKWIGITRPKLEWQIKSS